jgi:hypothetical protein
MCVILYVNINGQKILAKNRDRVYKPYIEIVHEIVNGIELAYIRDNKNGWIEGLNENGCGIVNSTLDIYDGKNRNEIINAHRYRSLELRNKKNKMYNALIESNETNFFKTLLKKDDTSYLLEGHTLTIFKNKIFHIEKNLDNKYIIGNIVNNTVFTNHGINLPNEGFTKGKKGVSSFLRKKITEEEIKNTIHLKRCDINLYDEILKMLNKNYYNIDPRFHPYRDKKTLINRLKHINPNDRIVNTTGQLFLNITNKELVYYKDTNNSEKVKYINKLPTNYVPKIRIIIKETEKNKTPSKIFTQKYIKKIYKKFGYHEKTIKNSMKQIKSRTRKHR